MSTRRDVTAGNAHRSQGTSAHRAAQAAQAYDLRLRGLTLRQIADEMGISHTTVHNLLREEISNRLDPLKDQYLQYELDRLDHMQQAALVVLDNPIQTVLAVVGKDPETGDPIMGSVAVVDDRKILGAVDRLLRISESRRKLVGLDAPVKSQVDVTVTETDQQDLELQELIREAKAKAAATAEALRQQGAPAPEGGA